jgi:uncharacterized membrane protein YkoI
MKKLGLLVFVCSCIVAVGSSVALADEGDDGEEREISLSDVPAAARAAIEQFAAGGEIEEVKQEEEDGQVVYEAEIEKDDLDSEITVSAAGEIIEKAVEISLDDVPEGVRTTIKAFAKVGKIDEIMREEEGDDVTYEAEIEIGKMELEIEVAASGIVLEVEVERKKKHDDDDDDDDDDDNGDDDNGDDDNDDDDNDDDDDDDDDDDEDEDDDGDEDDD